MTKRKKRLYVVKDCWHNADYGNDLSRSEKVVGFWGLVPFLCKGDGFFWNLLSLINLDRGHIIITYGYFMQRHREYYEILTVEENDRRKKEAEERKREFQRKWDYFDNLVP